MIGAINFDFKINVIAFISHHLHFVFWGAVAVAYEFRPLEEIVVINDDATMNEKAGKYVVRFTNESRSSSFDEYLLLECRVNSDAAVGIDEIVHSSDRQNVYDLNGRRVDSSAKGVLILRTPDGKTRKILRK